MNISESDRIETEVAAQTPEGIDWPEVLERRLEPVMVVLGLVFLVIVIAEAFIETGPLRDVLWTVGWGIWVAFVGEFILRAAVADSTPAYLRRNWWQIIFLLLPALRVLRALRALRVLRVARAGRIVSSAIRVSRTAGKRLGYRLVWLAVVTAVLVLASAQMLYEFGEYGSYGDALYGAAMATVSGQPIRGDGAVARLLSVGLGIYSVVIFGAMAGIVGAYFVERTADERSRAETDQSMRRTGSESLGTSRERSGRD